MKKLMMGNEAFAHAALEAGVGVVAGYPGTPSSEVIETVAGCVAAGTADGVHVEWSTNEKAALEVVAGASYAGARTLFTCKQVGLNVASDPLMSFNYVGANGGTVLYVADDPGPISSQTEQDTRRFASFAKIPVFDPADIEQGCAMIAAAYQVSEKHRCPVIVRPTTRVCHSSTYVETAESTQAAPASGFEKDSRWVIFPARAYRGHLEIRDRLQAMEREFSEGPLAVFNPIEEYAEGGVPVVPPAPVPASATAADPADPAASAPPADPAAPRLGILCGGVSTAYAREALAMLGESAPACRLMQVGTPYPFPSDLVETFVDGLDEVLVFEELDHVLEDELTALMGRRAVAGKPVACVLGKLTGHVPYAGELSALAAARTLAQYAGVEAPVAAPVPEGLPARPPVLCAGCPHRGAFYAAKQALHGRPAVFSGDIGCYTLGNAAPLDAVDTCLCMGAGITMAQGLGTVQPGVKQLAFVGDSTFFASGLTGVANAVYNRHDITVCVLDNSTTAMTGGQPHPGTGRTLMGQVSEPLSIEAALQALGVRCIVGANPHDLAESVAAVSQAVDFEGPAAVVFRAPCVNLVKRDATVQLDAQQCTGCRKCITSIGCPAIGFDRTAVGPKSGSRGQVAIDAAQCTGCGLCTHVCPFGALSVPVPEAPAAPGTPATSAPAAPVCAPSPVPASQEGGASC